MRNHYNHQTALDREVAVRMQQILSTLAYMGVPEKEVTESIERWLNSKKEH